MRRIALQFTAKIGLLFVFAVPIGMFIRASGTFGGSARATTAGKWHPTQPLIGLAGLWNVGWALRGHKPTPDQVKMLILTGALPEPPAPSVATRSRRRSGLCLPLGGRSTAAP